MNGTIIVGALIVLLFALRTKAKKSTRDARDMTDRARDTARTQAGGVAPLQSGVTRLSSQEASRITSGGLPTTSDGATAPLAGLLARR